MSNFTIINYLSDRDVSDCISKLPTESNILIVARKDNPNLEKYKAFKNVAIAEFPAESINRGKARNMAIDFGKEKYQHGFMHVLEDSIKIIDVEKFLPAIEKFMSLFDLASWYNTVCDQVNYVFAKYNPRVGISLDEDKYKKFGIDRVLYCSNANFEWSIFNLDTVKDYEIKVDEYYNVPMYMIIETLAGRRNNKQAGEMHYMNYYPTILEEKGAFVRFNDRPPKLGDNEVETENAHFREKNINHDHDTSVDLLMEDISAMLDKKL